MMSFRGNPPAKTLRVNDLAWEEKIFLIAKHTYVFRVLFDPQHFYSHLLLISGKQSSFNMFFFIYFTGGWFKGLAK